MSFYTPLRYPGGKGQLACWLGDVIEANGGASTTYVEPYAGGCGAGIFLLQNNKISNLVINDADPAIYAFWYSVFHRTNELIDRILSTPISIAERDAQKIVLSHGGISDTLALGFAAFYLNRTNRSGILSAGVIGGKAQEGEYRLDARFNPTELALRIQLIADHKDSCTVSNSDAAVLLKQMKRRRGNKTLIYLDPPYYVKGSQLYRNYYDHADHVNIASLVRELRVPWLVSYDDCPEIRSIYKFSMPTSFAPYYSTHASRARKVELLYAGNVNVPSAPYMRRMVRTSPLILTQPHPVRSIRAIAA